jgi:hypothetical protein
MVKKPACGPLRYFLVIGLHPFYALIVLAAIVAVGLVTLALDPRELDAGLGMVLFAQMFLASTGFAGRARQGHFDPLLVRSRDRLWITAAHWLASIVPGLAAWLVLAACASVRGADEAVSALTGGRAAALLIVSALAWAVGFRLPRGAAGMLWFALLMALVLQRAELLAAPAGTGPVQTTIVHAATLIVCPFLLLGKHPPLAPGAMAIAIAVPSLALCCVWQQSRTLDVYLVDRS